jgi:hypothetical protein
VRHFHEKHSEVDEKSQMFPSKDNEDLFYIPGWNLNLNRIQTITCIQKS